MTVKELKEYLSKFSDDTKIVYEQNSGQPHYETDYPDFEFVDISLRKYYEDEDENQIVRSYDNIDFPLTYKIFEEKFKGRKFHHNFSSDMILSKISSYQENIDIINSNSDLSESGKAKRLKITLQCKAEHDEELAFLESTEFSDLLKKAKENLKDIIVISL